MSRGKKNPAFYSCLFILWNKNKLYIYCHSAGSDKIATVQIVIMPFLWSFRLKEWLGRSKVEKHNIWDSTFNLRIQK